MMTSNQCRYNVILAPNACWVDPYKVAHNALYFGGMLTENQSYLVKLDVAGISSFKIHKKMTNDNTIIHPGRICI